VIKKSLIILIFFLYFFFQNSSIIAEVYIKVIVNNEIITNYDLNREAEYLKILNPEIEKLTSNQINEISKNSLINHIIKKKEINKYYDENINNDFIEEYYLNIIKKLGFEFKEEAFIKILNNKNTYSTKEIKDKIKIELLWNELIYSKFKNQVKINEEKLIKRIENEKKTIKNYFLSEIVFQKKKDENINVLINKILLSINEIGFNNTANIYSISDSAKFGGKIGWVEENMLSKNIIKQIDSLSVGQVSKPIKIGNNFILFKINEIKINEIKTDKKKELERLINNETNIKLNQFSKIYFDKIKMNYNINEN
jgi:peptidyl-prolyl cis-trans isomerase SurA